VQQRSDQPAADRISCLHRSFLEVCNVDLIYSTNAGPIVALKEFYLQSPAGEFTAVIGPSGCGKSTLLKLISGLIQPSGGEIRIDGTTVIGPRPEVGLMFQAPTLLPWKTVLDNVLVPIRAMRLRAADYREKAVELLGLMGLERFSKNYPGELSGGMQQRVSLARAFIHDPKLLLMDEPFAALDAMTREQMAEELQRIWISSPKSVVFITHHIPEAVFLADRVLVVSARPGRVTNDIAIDLSRPRTLDTLADPRFTQICNRLRRDIQASSTSSH
jgi:NitT/TauT family transport system ATP-binding protein